MHDSQGNFFNLDAALKSYAYNLDKSLASITATLGSAVWIKTYTYSNGDLVSQGQWEKQP